MHELPQNPTLSDYQQLIGIMCKQHGWDKNTTSDVFLLLTEEVGEVAKEIRRLSNFKGQNKTGDVEALSHELADVLNYLFEIANRFDIDLEAAYRAKHKINSNRTWVD